MQAAFIGIDWGTTHRRVLVLDAGGRVLAARHDGQGVLACNGQFAASLQALRAEWPGVPVVMAGMVGSAAGWQEVPYLDAEVPLAQLGHHLAPLRDAAAGERVFIVPGLRWRDGQGRVDVMRGEETQLLGALQALGPDAADGWYVLPGTHSKWVRLVSGRVAVLRTYMSGELFALLRERGTLAPLMQGEASPGDDALFKLGVGAVGDEALSHALFGARARVVGGGEAAAGTAAYVSGVLIGAEWRDLMALRGLQGPVRVIGEPELARLHALCARRLGVQVQMLESQALQLRAWQAVQQAVQQAVGVAR